MSDLFVGFAVTKQDIDKGCFQCIQRKGRCHKPVDLPRTPCWECMVEGLSSQCNFTNPIDPKKYILELPSGSKHPRIFQNFQPSNTFQTKEASSFGQSGFNVPSQHQYIPLSNVQSSNTSQTKGTSYSGQSGFSLSYQQHTDNVATQYIPSSDAVNIYDAITSTPKSYTHQVEKPGESDTGIINYGDISTPLISKNFSGKSYSKNSSNGRYLDGPEENDGNIEAKLDYEQSKRYDRIPQSDSAIANLTSCEELRKLAGRLGIRTFLFEDCRKGRKIETDPSLLSFKGRLFDSDTRKEIAVTFMQQRQSVKGIMEKTDQTKPENDLAVLAQLASSLNIVRLLGLTFDDFHPIFIFERAERTLEEYLQNQSDGFSTVSWNTKLHLCVDICYGVRDMHRNRIIHGDLSGSNVLIFQREVYGEPKAKISNVAFRSTPRKKAYTITPFTAPECTRSGVLKYPVFQEWCEREAQDVYSIGLLLWQMAMNGKIPYENMDLSSIEAAKISDPNLNSLMDQLPASTPKDVRLCIQMATKFMPGQRSSLRNLRSGLCCAIANLMTPPPETAHCTDIPKNDIIPKISTIPNKALNEYILPKNDSIPEASTIPDKASNEVVLLKNDVTQEVSMTLDNAPSELVLPKAEITPGPPIILNKALNKFVEVNPAQRRHKERKNGCGRLRVETACRNCRSNKRKCSGVSPCTRCDRRKIKCEIIKNTVYNI